MPELHLDVLIVDRFPRNKGCMEANGVTSFEVTYRQAEWMLLGALDDNEPLSLQA